MAGRMLQLAETTHRAIDEEVERMIAEAYRDAIAMVEDHREPLDRLAGALLASEELDRLEIAAALGEPPPPPPARPPAGPRAEPALRPQERPAPHRAIPRRRVRRRLATIRTCLAAGVQRRRGAPVAWAGTGLRAATSSAAHPRLEPSRRVTAGAADVERPRLGPGPRRERRRLLLGVTAAVVVTASALILFAELGQLKDILRRIEHASPGLVGVAVAFEALSFAGYVVLARTVFGEAAPRISWRESVDITLAGVVATRLLTAAGAGGIALTAWALRGAGLDGRTTARRVAAFLVVLYAVFFAALLVVGAALAAGELGGGAPRGLALAGAAVGGLVIATALAALLVPDDLERRARAAAEGRGRLARLADLLVTVPAVARESVGLALRIARHERWAVAAAVAWWGFDIAVLWSTFEMFGGAPSAGVLVLCYFLGQLTQVIPVPGGIGPVEGGMIGAFAACDVSVSLAVLAVLAYQAVSRWLPLAPGVWGYLRLRKSVAAWSNQRQARAL